MKALTAVALLISTLSHDDDDIYMTTTSRGDSSDDCFLATVSEIVARRDSPEGLGRVVWEGGVEEASCSIYVSPPASENVAADTTRRRSSHGFGASSFLSTGPSTDPQTSRALRRVCDESLFPVSSAAEPPCVVAAVPVLTSTASSCSPPTAVNNTPSAAPVHHEIQRVTVVVLGAHGAGKTSLVRQFVLNEFSEEYKPTRSRAFYHLSIILNESIYEVKLVDCSSVGRFPVNSLHEWNEHRGCCLRNASAYLLVYDVTDDESFRYVRSMRDQIIRYRDARDVPIFVAANKQDLIVSANHGTAPQPRGGPSSLSLAAAAESVNRAAKNREIQANVIKKQWKCGYVECSSKYNWRVTTVFKELIRAVDHIQQGHHKAASHRVQQALRIGRCVIL